MGKPGPPCHPAAIRHHWTRRARLAAPVLLGAAVASTTVAANLESSLRHLLDANDLKGTQVSAHVVDLDHDRVLAEFNSDEAMIPASNMKLLTTAAALHTLGGDFQFRTELAMIPPADAVADAVLLIRADGDPAFGDPVLLQQHGLTVDRLLEQWVEAVRQTGVKHFSRLIVDDGVFDRQFVHPTWPQNQLQKHWCAQVAGLNFHRNCMDATFVPAANIGAAPQINLFPAVPFVEITNLMTTGKTDTFSIDRKMGTNALTFRGTIHQRPFEPWQVTVHDPPMFFGRVLQHRLRDAGIEVRAVERISGDSNPPPANVLHSVRTALPLVLTRTNRDSQNMFAEALFKRIGHKVTGAAGSWENGAAAMRVFLKRHLGPRASAAIIADGSGMSRDNRITARMISKLLEAMYDDPKLGEIYRDSLAYAGRTHEGEYKSVGTFVRTSRFQKLPAGHWVFGKSGYIKKVSALSGYLFVSSDDDEIIADGADDSGAHYRTIAFSFLFNNFKPPKYNRDMKQLQEKMIYLIDTTISDPAKLGG